MKKIQALRGTKDIVGEEALLWDRIEETARTVFEHFGFEPIRIPIMEESALFRRSVGEATDIVQKEMYRFKDRSRIDVALRPEGTAGVARCLIEHHLQRARPVNKFYYFGPMFRAERPQRGRLRQFHQIGAEIFGSESPYTDVEAMEVLVRFLEGLGIREGSLEVNTLGTAREREVFAKKLSRYFAGKRPRLCPDCRERLRRNVLRILDCKNRNCEPLIQNAPRIQEALSPESRAIFDRVRGALDLLKIPYRWNARIVRGLDYYTHTVYELIHPALGSQDALAAGGRYDDLVGRLGGERTPAAGFALGVERLCLVLEKVGKSARSTSSGEGSVSVIAVGETCQDQAYGILSGLRGEGLSARMDFENRSLKAQMRQASRTGSRLCVIVGENELNKGRVIVKDMVETSGLDQEEIPVSGAASYVREKLRQR